MADWDLARDPLVALREGDPAPYEEFVRTHTRAFFAFFRRQGATLHEAEDLTQDVFLKLYNHAEHYRAQERFGALAMRVARNAWIDSRRRSASRRTVSADDAPAPVEERPSPERAVLEHLSEHEEAGRLRQALGRLPDAHRAVFELGVVEELGYADIASILGIPVGTVKSRMFHAVRKLRVALGEEDTDPQGGLA